MLAIISLWISTGASGEEIPDGLELLRQANKEFVSPGSGSMVEEGEESATEMNSILIAKILCRLSPTSFLLLDYGSRWDDRGEQEEVPQIQK